MTMPGPASPRTGGLPRVFWFGVIGMLLAAVLPLPYGYYQLLRLVTFGASAAVAWRLIENRRDVGWAFVVLALLYNPLFRVHLTREVWAFVNVATAAAFGWAWWATRRSLPER